MIWKHQISSHCLDGEWAQAGFLPLLVMAWFILELWWLVSWVNLARTNIRSSPTYRRRRRKDGNEGMHMVWLYIWELGIVTVFSIGLAVFWERPKVVYLYWISKDMHLKCAGIILLYMLDDSCSSDWTPGAIFGMIYYIDIIYLFALSVISHPRWTVRPCTYYPRLANTLQRSAAKRHAPYGCSHSSSELGPQPRTLVTRKLKLGKQQFSQG